MAFHKSSHDIDVIDGYLLAICTDRSGQDRDSELKLDLHLGNLNGAFEWGGTNFSRTARDVFVIDEGGSSFLHAKLQTKTMTWKDAKVDLSDRITNVNGKLKYLPEKEPHAEGSREFLGEERDFLSTAISETISDLRELFTDSPLFSTSRSEPLGRERHRASQRNRYGPREAAGSGTSHSDMEKSTTSTGTSVADSKGDPPSYGKGQHPYRTSPDRVFFTRSEIFRNIESQAKQPEKSEISERREATEDEGMILEQVKDFLLKDDGNSVRSFKTEKGGRRFELRDAKGVTKVLHIQGRVLFDQDDYKTPSVSETSDLDYDRCMTPSVVDGEDEYDFLK